MSVPLHVFGPVYHSHLVGLSDLPRAAKTLPVQTESLRRRKNRLLKSPAVRNVAPSTSLLTHWSTDTCLAVSPCDPVSRSLDQHFRRHP